MFTPVFFVGLGFLFVSLFASRFMAERAVRLLSSEEKLRLLDSFSRLRVFGALPLVFVVVASLGLQYLPASWFWLGYATIWVSLALYFGLVHRYVLARMKNFGINADFIAAQAKARWVQYFGFFLFFLTTTFGPFLWK